VKADAWLPLLSELADRADAVSLRHFRSRTLRIEEKSDHSLVTEADLEVEAAVRATFGTQHPGLGVFGEEQGEQPGSGDTRLIVDPIDATANFARGIPVWATLLAIEQAGEVVTGLVSAPALGQRWHAARGAGAWSGERRLRVSSLGELEKAQLFHGSLAGGEAVLGTRRIAGLIERTHRQRGFGDFYQHMLVAEGCGELAIDPIVSPWDVAALQVIVEEAGGRSTTTRGERSIYAGSLLSSNGLLHDEALEILKRG
jgi:histidinol-phosphatase